MPEEERRPREGQDLLGDPASSAAGGPEVYTIRVCPVCRAQAKAQFLSLCRGSRAVPHKPAAFVPLKVKPIEEEK